MVRIPFCLDKDKLINDLKIISWEAADILLYYSEEIKDIKHKNKIIKNKGKNDPVTLADLKVNDLIIQRIREKYSVNDYYILSEESKNLEFDKLFLNSDWAWVLDPLDGTKDFIQGTEHYAMHLALNYKRRPFLGVVLIPSKGELWISNSKKTWCEKRDGSNIKNKISCKNSLNEMTIVTSKNHRNNLLESLINKVNFKKRIIMGSIGCKIASILRGESDIYISLSLPGQGSPKDWDFAAPEAILIARGGAITNLDNEKLTYGNPNFEQGGVIIASKDIKTHKSLCLEIKAIIQKYDIYPL